MLNVVEKSLCTGCAVCSKICHKEAIHMNMDENGFLYPEIEQNKCVDCRQCIKICPVSNPPKVSEKTYAYAYQNKDNHVRFQSTSGGFFAEIASKIIENGGLVCGAAYDSSMKLVHILTNKTSDLEKLQKSKYVQSDIESVYSKIKKEVLNGKDVLFVGLPCQVAAIHNYMEKDFDNLILIDSVCYGVPSPGLFKEWIDYLNEKYKNNVQNVVFREKSYGYATPNIKVEFENGKKIETCRDANIYSNLFFKNLTARPSCYQCKFKSVNRASDITLGDLWMVSEYDKKMDDNKGTTAVFVHSEKAMKYCEELCEKALDLATIVSVDARKLVDCAVPSNYYKKFWNDYQSLTFDKLIDKYEPETKMYKLKMLLKFMMNKSGVSKIIFKRKKRRKLGK